MITLKNSGPLTVTWYALPKYSIDLNTQKPLAKGTLAPNAETTYNPPTTVNILFALDGRDFAALCTAPEGSTVVYHQPASGTWCVVE